MEEDKTVVRCDPSLPVPTVPVVEPKPADIAQIFGPPKRKEKPERKGKVKRAEKTFGARKKWPNACIRCGGDGGTFKNPEVEDDNELEIDLCPQCLKKGKCPRCAANLPAGWKQNVMECIDPPVKCKNCKWEDGDDPVLYIDED